MDKVQFKISSALKDLVGKDLIRNNNIAIFELVKNSYDAFATKVILTFESDRIEIADNGKGMTFEDLKNKWLFLAYSAKKDGTEDSIEEKKQSYRDQINRHYAGAKGVGRFSCDRLGETLILTTKSSRSKNAERLIVNWKDFEKDQRQEFVSINVGHERVDDDILFPEDKKTGTILRIEGLREPWNRKEILELKRSLEKLINPFSDTSSFSIEIVCNAEKKIDDEEIKKQAHDRNIVNGLIKNSITKVIGLKTTRIDVLLKDGKIKTTLNDRDTDIYRIEEKNSFEKLSNVQISLYFLNQAAKVNFTKEMGVQPVQYGSIFLFRNGFRILPFGNPGDDSWKINYRAQQGYNRFLATRDLFGRVDIQTDEIDEFKEVSSRDGGLIESLTTIQLKEAFKLALIRLERYVVGVLWGGNFIQKQYFKNTLEAAQNREMLRKDKNNDSPSYIIKSSLGSKIDFVQLVRTLISDKNVNVLYYNKDLANIFSEPNLFNNANPQVISDLEKIAEKTKNSDLLYSIDEAKKKIIDLQKQKEEAESRAEEASIQAYEANVAKEKAEYEASVASIKLENSEKANESLRQDFSRVSSENLFLASDVNKDVKQLSALQHHITHTSSFIHELAIKALEAASSDNKEKTIYFIQRILFENTKIATLSNFVSKAKFDVMSKKITQNIVTFVNEYMKNVYSLANSEMSIHVKSSPILYEIKFAPIDFIVVLDCLLDNSRKAKAKNIFIEWKSSSENICLSFADDGNGISDKIMPNIFDYRFSTTGGGGLGLFHVHEICAKMGVEIHVENLEKGVEFTFKFKKVEK